MRVHRLYILRLELIQYGNHVINKMYYVKGYIAQ